MLQEQQQTKATKQPPQQEQPQQGAAVATAQQREEPPRFLLEPLLERYSLCPTTLFADDIMSLFICSALARVTTRESAVWCRIRAEMKFTYGRR